MTAATTSVPPSPAEVHGILARHTLADGFDVVFDIDKSHGSWLHDARADRDLLDFCTFSASNPVGYNHPKMKDPAYLKVLHRVAQLKPALSDLYSVERALQRKAREHESFFVLDEVQTGVGITGKMWAHEHFGLEPDAVAFGKKMQVCGCMVGPRLDQEPENAFKVSSRINSTWGGGLTDMVRAGRYLEVIHEDGLVENARVMGERLLGGLRALQEELGGVMTNARGRGLMIAFDLETPALRDRAQDRMLANGLLLLGCGTRSIRFRPPLDLATAEADAALEIVGKSLKEL